MNKQASIPIASFAIMLAVPALLMNAQAAPTNLLLGVTFHDGPEVLSGKLAFMVTLQSARSLNTTNPAAIYEFNLQLKSLRKICDAPWGQFVPSIDGSNLFCVYYSTNSAFPHPAYSAFVFSGNSGQSRTTPLPAVPTRTLLTGDHAYFQVRPGRLGTTEEVLVYDPVQDTKRFISVADSPIPKLDLDFKAADGRYVFFEGPDAPIHGTRLVASFGTLFEKQSGAAHTKAVSILNEFPKAAMGKYGQYTLDQLSPCRQYALVKLSVAHPNPLRPSRNGWGFKFFLVSLADGHTRLLLEDKVVETCGGLMSQVFWVP